MTDLDTLQAQWAQYAEDTERANSLNKAIVFAALREAGITLVNVSFDGEGDSGQIDEIIAHNTEGVAIFPDMKVSLYRAHSGETALATAETKLREAVEELCYGYLEKEYGGWENNDGGFGEFTFDVSETSIELEFNARFTDHSTSTHSF
jgi:hypothetical protein